ncbi:MAG: hypothetical protein RIG77_00160 [Cyclobacteriaceae bacterium]
MSSDLEGVSTEMPGYTFLRKLTNEIVSKTFEFNTTTQDCDTINITDGRFDWSIFFKILGQIGKKDENF